MYGLLRRLTGSSQRRERACIDRVKNCRNIVKDIQKYEDNKNRYL